MLPNSGDCYEYIPKGFNKLCRRFPKCGKNAHCNHEPESLFEFHKKTRLCYDTQAGCQLLTQLTAERFRISKARITEAATAATVIS